MVVGSEIYLYYIFSNKISEMEQLGYLGLCPKLIALQIDGNPFCILLSSNIEVCSEHVLCVLVIQ